MFLEFQKVRTKHYYKIGYCFLFSQMPQENTKEQLQLLFGEVERRKYNPDFERI